MRQSEVAVHSRELAPSWVRQSEVAVGAHELPASWANLLAHFACANAGIGGSEIVVCQELEFVSTEHSRA